MKKLALIFLSILILTGCSKARRLTSVVPFGEVNGKVSPVVPASVSLYRDSGKVWEGNTDPATGKFNVTSLTSGSYALSVSADGFEPVNQNISVQEGQISEVEITLNKLKLTFGEVNGKVSPVVPASITLYKDNIKIWEGNTDPITGEFHIGSLISGLYTLMVSADGFVPVNQNILVQAGQITKIKIALMQNFVPGEVLVSFKDEVTKEEVQQIISSYGLNETEWGDWIIAHFVIVKVPVGTELDWIAKLEEHPKIEYAELNYIYSVFEATIKQP